MTVDKFLAAVLPSQGHRFFLSTYGTQGTPDFRPVQRAFAPGTEAGALAFARKHSGRGANSYFATGGFMPPPVDPATGRPKGGRTADRVTHLRCLRLDVDCGVDKPYTDKHAGLRALADFCNHYHLPLPWILDSGYGLHAYWALDRDLPLAEWLGLAQRLATGCAASGFAIDTTATLDAARVLRVPGTNNYKRGGSAAVRIVAEGTPAAPEQLAQHLPQAAAPAPRATGAGSELQQNLHRPYFLRGVLSRCPGMAAMLTNGGAQAREPLWKAALDLVWKAGDTADKKLRVARAISQGHPGFTEEGLAAKWQQVQRQDYHPPSCATLRAAGMKECQTCPLWGQISSPLTLGYPDVAPPAPAAPASPAAAPPPPAPAPPPPAPAPAGIFRPLDAQRVSVVDGRLNSRIAIKGGCVRAIRSRPDGSTFEAPLLDYRITSVERLLDAVGRRSLIAFTFDRGLDKPARVEFTNAELTDGRLFHSAMVGNGLYISRKTATDLLEMFMPDFLAQLQRVHAANKIAAQCGWTEDMAGFVLGDTLYTGTGTEPVRPGTVPEEMFAFHAHGDAQAWRRAMDIVLAGGADRQAVVALALASPLMPFTGLDGLLLNAYSPESGIGKSTLGDAALSVWGSPDKLRKSARDTANATWRLAGTLGNMPMVIDEFTNIDGRALSDFVYTVTQGREKHRLTTDAKLQAGGAQRWCLAAITTANNSVHDKLQAFRLDATAEAARVFDLRLRPLAVAPEQLGLFKTELQALRANYGFLGPQLVQVFLSKSAADWRRLVMKKITQWDQRVAQGTSDRFRSACAALIEVGAAIGAALGLNFDLSKIRDVVEASWQQQIRDFEAERRKPIDFVLDYITDNGGEFATIGGATGDALLANLPRRVRGEVRGRTVDGRFKPSSVMIPTVLLREYIREKNGNYKAFQEWLQTELYSGLIMRMGRLMYLEGQVGQHTTSAIEFSAAIVNDGVMLRLAPPAVASIPPAPARAHK